MIKLFNNYIYIYIYIYMQKEWFRENLLGACWVVKVDVLWLVSKKKVTHYFLVLNE